MSVRELVLLGTASQVPTRERNHNGYALRWDRETVLFDPGEGTQRQLTLAGVSAASITRICITHFHGDHCLGLPGVLQRMALDQVERAVDLYFPASGRPYVDRLLAATVHRAPVDVHLHPLDDEDVVAVGDLHLRARRLDHSTDTLGWRLEEPESTTMIPARLAAFGIAGPDIGRLQRDGAITVGRQGTDGRTVRLDEVSVVRPGQTFAFVMDTGRCEAAQDLAAGADMVVCESTFLDEHADLAAEYQHLTAADAARIARTAGARRLVLTHFSQRYTDAAAFGDEARRHFDDVVVGADLLRVPVPPRRSIEQPAWTTMPP